MRRVWSVRPSICARRERSKAGKMDSLKQKMQIAEGYCEVVLASEQEKLPEIERLKEQMDSFEEDRGRSRFIYIIPPPPGQQDKLKL